MATEIQPNPYLGYINRTDITEEFLSSIEEKEPSMNNVTEELNANLKITEAESSSNKKTNKDVECDLCGKYYTARGFKQHRNDCVNKPQNHRNNCMVLIKTYKL